MKFQPFLHEITRNVKQSACESTESQYLFILYYIGSPMGKRFHNGQQLIFIDVIVSFSRVNVLKPEV
jgi:hypothetical protein